MLSLIKIQYIAETSLASSITTFFLIISIQDSGCFRSESSDEKNIALVTFIESKSGLETTLATRIYLDIFLTFLYMCHRDTQLMPSIFRGKQSVAANLHTNNHTINNIGCYEEWHRLLSSETNIFNRFNKT